MRRTARLIASLLVLFLLLLTVSRAHADAPPVIAAGREAEVVALASPYFGTGKELSPGCKLGDVEVAARVIRFHVICNAGHASLRLEHLDVAAKEIERTASFAVFSEGGSTPEVTAALRTLIDVVRANDEGGFFRKAGPEAGSGDPASSRFAKGRAHWLTTVTVPRPLRDGVLLVLAAVTFTVLHVRRVLRAEARNVALALVALIAIGAALRMMLSRETIMNVWPYTREVPLARLVFEGVVLQAVSRALHLRFYLTDVIFKTTAVLAILTPLAFFAHARYVLRDTRGALFATALLVVLPNHIRFSGADSELIQSLATSSLTFVVLYTALRDTSKAWRTVCFALLPVLSIATYFVRPENLFFFFVDVGAIWLTSGEEAPRRRKVVALVEVTAAAIFALLVHVLARYQSAVRQGLSMQTLKSAVTLFFDLRLNTLLNVAITPPGLTLLAVAGAVLLYRRGERARALFLGSWLLGFFVVHSFVRPSQPEMQARYHLHLITPLLLLAASALPDALRLRRRYLVIAGLYFAASPLLHRRFIRDTEFNEMREFNFLRAATRSIPEGCTVLELSPALGSDPDIVLASRLDRMSIHLADGAIRRAFRVINMGRLGDARIEGERYEVISQQAGAVLDQRPGCVMVYVGLTCRSHRPPLTENAPVCDDIVARAGMHPIAATTFSSRLYDEVLAGRLITEGSGSTLCVPRLVPGELIPLALYR